ncbi:two-component system histidine kinase [Amycolatopsis mediterranei S699]|uniref:Two-component system histidine kinase n=2 Tax=Amycolatopsis mediterranei TaxID=33910 RepID=A0A0H3DET9_AMYMU|nr:histidine kinase [Amycolatopsis mediterranei]ADJ48603.1 two-component system histidine kinase [Amycolatopsis mediterranei U32]AEK45535.1 two-component system histidine kinase [Amycolatopsis mediterranei S699]AFO80312.1 two-component system histidine kinase [Amycolatopsis mediterranei S699]AGT87440.1 two-component system histidine kinase [Amycolatopsis mediterranei RB]KDO11212.1 histidine kinase [Amycolatopsis mediterranei]
MTPAAALEPSPARSATAEPRGTTAADRRPRLATYLASAIIVVVVAGFSVIGLVSLLPTSVGVLGAAYALFGIAALLTIQLLWFSRPTVRLDSVTSRVLLAVMVVLAYVPILTFGLNWADMPDFVGGAVLLVLPSRYAWTALAGVVVSIGWIYHVFGASPLITIYGAFGALFYSLLFYLLARLARMVHRLHEARTELAQRAVAEQRLAFARDLNDLLGLSLSAIALKGELVHRLMRKSVEQAKAELADITATAQRTLSDVRAVSHGYRELSLEKESRTAETLLSASEIAVRVHLDQGDLPVQARTLLAKALREGVTDVLRLDDVEHCEIDVRHRDGRVTLEIVSDGVPPGDPDSGLTTLSGEISALGGTATAKSGADGRFRLRVELPVPERLDTAASSDAEQRSDTESKRIRGLLPVVMGLMGSGATVHLLQVTTRAWEVALVVGSIAALLALQFSYFNRPSTPLRSAQSYGMLFVQVCLIYLPLLPLGPHWVSVPGLLIGSALLVLPPVAGWAFFALNIAAYAAIQHASGADTTTALFYTAATVMTGLAVFGLLWLVRLVTELDNTRRRLAEMALAEERLRFARDLHDLLGMSLSAIALKSELTARVLPLDRDRAAEELTEVLGLTRQALSDVRSVASGYRELSLDSESRTAKSVLAAADVRVRMEMLADDLPTSVRTVLAVVLREGVTNVLRHSRVETCEIAMRRTDGGVVLEIVNDGVERNGDRPRSGRPADADVPEPPGPRDTSPGSGIGNLSHRLADLGGELTAGVEPDGRFRLRAAVPV